MSMKMKLKKIIDSEDDEYTVIKNIIKCLKEEYDDEMKLEEVMYVHGLDYYDVEINMKRYKEVPFQEIE